MSKEPQRVLITGASGFVGRALVKNIEETSRGLRPYAFSRSVDVRDSAALRIRVQEVRPHFIVHLAAKTYDPASWVNPTEFLEVNVLGTLSLLEALDAARFKGRLLFVSTGAVYGNVPETCLPIREETNPRPVSPYALSKLGGELLCSRWQRERGFDVVIARPFNIIGLGQKPGFVVSDFLTQISSTKQGKSDEAVITVGDLNVTRDFLDVHDVADALVALLQRGLSGEIYNVCSGRETVMSDLLHSLLQQSGTTAEIEVDKTKLRPIQQRRAVGLPTKIQAQTGWRPRIPLEESIRRLIAE